MALFYPNLTVKIKLAPELLQLGDLLEISIVDDDQPGGASAPTDDDDISMAVYTQPDEPHVTTAMIARAAAAGRQAIDQAAKGAAGIIHAGMEDSKSDAGISVDQHSKSNAGTTFGAGDKDLLAGCQDLAAGGQDLAANNQRYDSQPNELQDGEI